MDAQFRRTSTQATGKLFYGWVIVAVMAAAGALGMAMGTLNFGLFIKPMGDDLGIGRAVFGWAQTARQVTSAVSSPYVGGMIDRFGSRVLLAVFTAITGAALVAVGFISQGWQLVALFALMGVVSMAGPGALVTTVPVAKWFVQKRGKAFSFVSLGIPIGGITFIPLTQVFIDSYGWRAAWIILAVIGAGILVPLSLIFIRRQPEDMGLVPDGVPRSDGPGDPIGTPVTGPNAPRSLEEVSWTKEEALRSSAFWRLTFVFGMVSLAMGSVAIHRIPSFMDRGLDARLVSYATSLDAAAAGVSTFAMGMLVHRIPARILGSWGLSIMTLATVLTITANSVPIMFLAMIAFGLGVGALMFMQNYMWADYFGRQHLGEIRGVVMPITLVLGGAGAPVAGYVRDYVGSYNSIWFVGALLLAIGTATLALTPPPKKRPVTPIPSEA